MIETPPTKLYTKGEPIYRLLIGAHLVKKVLIVATGSGIGPGISLFVENKTPCRYLWSTRDPEKTYVFILTIPSNFPVPHLDRLLSCSSKIADSSYSSYGTDVIKIIKAADPEAVIWNTSARGYPDLVLETYKMYLASGAEAIYIVSNKSIAEKVRFAMESCGIAIYGPIFDA